ncbi:MAG: hypothetical protein V3V08_07880 [Nannocystaceae bacterium]
MSLEAEHVLALSCVVLVLGPLLHAVARRAPASLRALDGFVLVSVGGLVLLDIVPAAYLWLGWGAVVLAVAGFVLPTVADGRIGSSRSHRAALWIALGGLAIHAAADGLGMALARTAGPGPGHAHSLEMAIVLHRIPVGIGVWWVWGAERRASAAVALVVIAVATSIGFWSGEASAEWVHSSWIGGVQAFVGGLLLHVVHHTGEHAEDKSVWSGLGGLVALVLLIAILGEHVGDRDGVWGAPGEVLAGALSSLGDVGRVVAGGLTLLGLALFVRRGPRSLLGSLRGRGRRRQGHAHGRSDDR